MTIIINLLSFIFVIVVTSVTINLFSNYCICNFVFEHYLIALPTIIRLLFSFSTFRLH